MNMYTSAICKIKLLDYTFMGEYTLCLAVHNLVREPLRGMEYL